MLKRHLTILILILSLTVGVAFKCSETVKDLATRAFLALAAAPATIDKLPISAGLKDKLKVAVKGASEAYKAYKDGKGTWGAFLAAFTEIVRLEAIDGWVGQFIAALRNLLGIPTNDFMAEAASEPDLKNLSEENVRALERLVGK